MCLMATKWLDRFGKNLGYRERRKRFAWLVVLREVIGKTISTITGLPGFFWISWDARKQGFHDKIADTVVVKV